MASGLCSVRFVSARLSCGGAGPGAGPASNNSLLVPRAVYSAASAALVLAPGFRRPWRPWVRRVGWMAVTSTLAARAALFLPVWVRARGLAVYMVMFTVR